MSFKSKIQSKYSVSEVKDDEAKAAQPTSNMKKKTYYYDTPTEQQVVSDVGKWTLYHGRHGSKYLLNDVVILWSYSYDDAEFYAGESGSVWKLTDEKVLVDAHVVSKKVFNFLKKQEQEFGWSPQWFDEIDRDYSSLGEIDPDNIVSHAGWWDNTDFVQWFCETFPKIKGVWTQDGAVTFSPSTGKPIRIR